MFVEVLLSRLHRNSLASEISFNLIKNVFAKGEPIGSWWKYLQQRSLIFSTHMSLLLQNSTSLPAHIKRKRGGKDPEHDARNNKAKKLRYHKSMSMIEFFSANNDLYARPDVVSKLLGKKHPNESGFRWAKGPGSQLTDDEIALCILVSTFTEFSKSSGM